MGFPIRRPAVAAIALLGLLVAAGPSQAGDVTAFVTFPSAEDAEDIWDRGFGAALTMSLLGVGALEAEAARLPIDTAEGTMTSFTGSALVALPIGPLVPYFGLGFGVYRQSLAALDETSTVSTFVAGAKLKLGLLVVRGDYRRITLHGDPLLPMDKRLTLGAGISF